ncbi:hypothetical protein [Glycomyces artemisiae]|uniref:Uncharacterized protein n=1 Tax=Glycomyces artemisiae TaxID=1076443 RepID=A0A2T0UEE9_9ACTN|nr:hypothetical protein [Glycomyces artemisiae]PRY56197.1 hypothetical protein B0I28_11079 [Glycomyces artemisiae]
MTTGDQRTLTIGAANGAASGLPRQGAAPQPESAPRQGLSIPVAPAPPKVRADSPEVRLRRLAGVAAWALVLVLAGVASAIVGLFKVFGDGPDWFTPAFISVGVVGMLLAMMAFATVRFKGVPWIFMAASTVTLLAAFAMLRA